MEVDILIFFAYFCSINMLICFCAYSSVIEDDLTDKQDQRANTKTHHKEFVQRMHNRNGNAFFSLSI
jgi:hypothetical protein